MTGKENILFSIASSVQRTPSEWSFRRWLGDSTAARARHPAKRPKSFFIRERSFQNWIPGRNSKMVGACQAGTYRKGTRRGGGGPRAFLVARIGDRVRRWRRASRARRGGPPARGEPGRGGMLPQERPSAGGPLLTQESPESSSASSIAACPHRPRDADGVASRVTGGRDVDDCAVQDPPACEHG